IDQTKAGLGSAGRELVLAGVERRCGVGSRAVKLRDGARTVVSARGIIRCVAQVSLGEIRARRVEDRRSRNAAPRTRAVASACLPFHHRAMSASLVGGSRCTNRQLVRQAPRNADTQKLDHVVHRAAPTRYMLTIATAATTIDGGRGNHDGESGAA